MIAQKIKKKLYTKAEDIAQFTLPSPQETAPEVKRNTVFSPVDLIPNSPGEGFFWHTKSGKIWTAVFGIFIALAIVSGLLIYIEGASKSNQQGIIPTPTPIIAQEQSPTPTPEIDVSKYKIEVLNGSGISGEAARAKQLLEEEKFTVSSIGNADTLNYQKTIIQSKKTVPKEFLEKLKSFLEKLYVLDDVKELDESEKSHVVIIVGSEKVSE